MPEEKALTLQQADSLYQSFPDFSAWPAPTEDGLDLWNRFASRLEEVRQNATPEALRHSVEVAVRAAAMDTGAIEGLYSVDRGFTMTVATQAFAWEHALEEKGEKVRELFAAQLETYELVIDAVTQALPISEAWIRALHEKVCAGQETYRVLTDRGYQEQELPRGRYKTQPNHVRLTGGGIHPYAPVDHVPTEMHRLLEQIRTPEFENAHPAAQAAYVHYAFVVIHPFADGNGRVARALASVFFYRAHSIPFLVFANQRNPYLDALRQADLGRAGSLLTFFLDRGVETFQLVIEHLRTAEAPKLASVADRIRLLDVAQKLLQAVRDQVEAQFGNLQVPLRLDLALRDSLPDYRDDLWDMGPTSLVIKVESSAYGRSSGRWVDVLIARDPSAPFPICLLETKSGDDLEVRLADIHPEIGESLRLRLASWCSRLLGRTLKELADGPELDEFPF